MIPHKSKLKLFIEEENKETYVFSYQRGGRDKYIKYIVKLVDERGPLVCGHNVQLDFELTNNGDKYNQKALLFSDSCETFISADTGFVEIIFRIESVSPSLSGKRSPYQVKISGKIEGSEEIEIEPVYGVPIDVYAKGKTISRAIENIVSSNGDETPPLKKKKRDVEPRINQLKTTINQLRTTINQLTTNNQQLTTNINQLTTNINQLTTTINQLTTNNHQQTSGFEYPFTRFESLENRICTPSEADLILTQIDQASEMLSNDLHQE